MQKVLEIKILKQLEWLLRVGVFLTFFGHGIFALFGKAGWLPYLKYFGFTTEVAFKLMFAIGIIDVIVAVSILFKPYKPIVIWAIIWALSTALIRPISGEPIWDFIERGSNWIVPLCLYLLLKTKHRNQ